MNFLKKFWSIILALIPSWIITIPLFQFLKKKQVHRQALVNTLSTLLFNMDDIINGDGKLPNGLQPELMPRHLAVIMDGSRRWAKKRGRVPVDGYEAGIVAIADLVSLCLRWKIPIVSLFMFSSENWCRPREEVDYLLEHFEASLNYSLSHYCRRFGLRVSVIGDKSILPNSLQKAVEQIEEETKDSNGLHLVLAMSYSGQNDIVHACQSIATKVKDGILQPEDITKSLFEQQLQTNVTDVPAPDLLIRTSGEIRISNYYLWQSAYSELYFTDALWPDFGEDEFVKALRSYQQRGRRFGKV